MSIEGFLGNGFSLLTSGDILFYWVGDKFLVSHGWYKPVSFSYLFSVSSAQWEYGFE